MCMPAKSIFEHISFQNLIPALHEVSSLQHCKFVHESYMILAEVTEYTASDKCEPPELQIAIT
jgi:hypothetical protein